MGERARQFPMFAMGHPLGATNLTIAAVYAMGAWFSLRLLSRLVILAPASPSRQICRVRWVCAYLAMRMKRTLVIVLAVASVAAAVILLNRSNRGSSPPKFVPTQNAIPAEIKKTLETGERFVLLSLDPADPALRPESDPPPKETFHDYAVLGKAEIRDQQERTNLLRALYKAVADSDGSVAACFNPRHGVSATSGGDTVELLICFECSSIETFTGHAEGPLTRSVNVATAHPPHSPEPIFNQALRRAGIPVSKNR